MDDSLLFSMLQGQTDMAARTEQKVDDINKRVDDINKRLFGNGQPGVIQTIAANTEETRKQLAEAKENLNDRISKVDIDRRLDRRWVAGATAVIVVVIGAVGFYFRYIYPISH